MGLKLNHASKRGPRGVENKMHTATVDYKFSDILNGGNRQIKQQKYFPLWGESIGDW